MRFVLLVTLVLVFYSCKREIVGDETCVRVMVANQHPFLVDHNRKLVSLNFSGDTLGMVDLYPDPGKGCSTHLFSSEELVIAIDCNGFWYSINKFTMEIKNEGWNWEQDLPEIYLGTFKYDKYSNDYSLDTSKRTVEMKDVYVFKDPEVR